MSLQPTNTFFSQNDNKEQSSHHNNTIKTFKKSKTGWEDDEEDDLSAVFNKKIKVNNAFQSDNQNNNNNIKSNNAIYSNFQKKDNPFNKKEVDNNKNGLQKSEKDISHNNKFQENQSKQINKPGGGWEDDQDSNIQINIKKSTTNNNQFDSNNEHFDDDAFKRNASYNNSSGEYETKIIEDIIRPGGVKIKPADNQLKEFVSKCTTFNKQLVIEIMINILKNIIISDTNKFHKSSKMLQAIEALIKYDYESDIQSSFKEVINDNLEKLDDILNKNQLIKYFNNNTKIINTIELQQKKIKQQLGIINKSYNNLQKDLIELPENNSILNNDIHNNDLLNLMSESVNKNNVIIDKKEDFNLLDLF